MKKILLSIPALYGGGAERVVSIWANQLDHLGYNVSLLLCGRKQNEYFVNKNVSVYSVADTCMEYEKLGYAARAKKTRSIIKMADPDVIISFLPRMQIWMMLTSFGIKAYRIETVRNNPWHAVENSKAEKNLWLLCFMFSNAIVIQTDEQREFFSKHLKKKCVVIPNPVSQESINSYKKEYSNKIRHFVAAGRITPQKNYPLMIQAFANAYKNNKDIDLTIYGEGDKMYCASLKQLINDLEMTDHIFMMGRSNVINREFLSKDCFIMTSDYEGFPNALMEAMAAGLVCISTDCRTGPIDLIDDGINGFLTPTGNIGKLENTIKKVIELDSLLAEEIGEKARNKVLDFCNETRSVNKLIHLIEYGVAK